MAVCLEITVISIFTHLLSKLSPVISLFLQPSYFPHSLLSDCQQLAQTMSMKGPGSLTNRILMDNGTEMNFDFFQQFDTGDPHVIFECKENHILQRSGDAMEQTAKGGDGAAVFGGVQESCRCSTWGHSWWVTLVVGGWLDQMIFPTLMFL